uniref:Uncharacterized protein n=1 Tax=Sphaeramia orbicularis TaxID=375764 RepID=A0A673A5U0_9TELE
LNNYSNQFSIDQIQELHLIFESRGTQVLVLGLDGAGKSNYSLNLCFLSVGGKGLRPYWQKYISKRFPLAKTHLHELLTSNPDLPLMVLANKQVSVTEKHSSVRKNFLMFMKSNKTWHNESESPAAVYASFLFD